MKEQEGYATPENPGAAPTWYAGKEGKLRVRDFSGNQLWLLSWSVMWRGWLLMLGAYMAILIPVLIIVAIVNAAQRS
jgi:hypothetical protein